MRGYDRTTVEDIAAASGVATSSLYAAYGNKAALFLRVFRRYCDARARLVAEAVAPDSRDIDEALNEFLARIVDDCLSYPDRRGCLMLTSIADLQERIPEVVEVTTATVATMKEIVTDKLVRTAHARGRRLTRRDAYDRAARAVVASQAVIHLSRLPLPRERLVAMGIALLPA